MLKREERKLLHNYLLTNPLPLGIIKDNRLLKYITSLLPCDTGFEIECGLKKESNASEIKNIFSNIPFIKHYDINNYEQRFRIPSGIQGFICLYFISLNLKIYHELNTGSGIHYHIDGRHSYEKLYNVLLEGDKLTKTVLKSLDTWKYKGTYNPRGVSRGCAWVRLNHEFDTYEIRIGEMTFDYELLVRRIIHGHQIFRRVEQIFDIYPPDILKENYEPVDSQLLKIYIEILTSVKEISIVNFKKLEELQKIISEGNVDEINLIMDYNKRQNELKQIIKQRIIDV